MRRLSSTPHGRKRFSPNLNMWFPRHGFDPRFTAIAIEGWSHFTGPEHRFIGQPPYTLAGGMMHESVTNRLFQFLRPLHEYLPLWLATATDEIVSEPVFVVRAPQKEGRDQLAGGDSLPHQDGLFDLFSFSA